jgi:lysophospholipase L1-like esterase
MKTIKNGWMFFDFFGKVKAFNPGVDTNGEWSLGDNTHPRNKGYALFGSAITDVLKAQ